MFGHNKHDRRARFEVEVLPHLDAAYRFARWLSNASDDVDDVVQDAVLRAFRGFDGLRGSDVKSWLLAIVRNCHFTAVKQRQRRGFVPMPDEDDALDGHAVISSSPEPESQAVQREAERTLAGLISTLPEEYRTVLMLREIEEMDYRQIAAVTQVPIGTVMSRLARSRAALKSRWVTTMEEKPRAVR